MKFIISFYKSPGENNENHATNKIQLENNEKHENHIIIIDNY